MPLYRKGVRNRGIENSERSSSPNPTRQISLTQRFGSTFFPAEVPCKVTQSVKTPASPAGVFVWAHKPNSKRNMNKPFSPYSITMMQLISTFKRCRCGAQNENHRLYVNSCLSLSLGSGFCWQYCSCPIHFGLQRGLQNQQLKSIIEIRPSYWGSEYSGRNWARQAPVLGTVAPLF